MNWMRGSQDKGGGMVGRYARPTDCYAAEKMTNL